jgi:hypothetical protein
VLGKLFALFAPPRPPTGALTGRRFILDGSNIALFHGPQHPELRYVLALASYLRRNGADYHCYFDANLGYLLRDFCPEALVSFERVTTSQPWSKQFETVPSGTQADEWILARAKKEAADVISNDRFRDRARAHRWIWKRRHAFTISAGRMRIPSLDANIALPETAALDGALADCA